MELFTFFIEWLKQRKDRFDYTAHERCIFFHSLSFFSNYEVIQEQQGLVLYEKAIKRELLKNEEEIVSFFEKLISEEDLILKKKQEIVDWVKKVYPETMFKGYILNFGSFKRFILLEKESIYDTIYAANYNHNAFYTSDSLEEAFQWLFEKIKKPIEKERMRLLFKEK